jgi:hypothetical protein
MSSNRRSKMNRQMRHHVVDLSIRSQQRRTEADRVGSKTSPPTPRFGTPKIGSPSIGSPSASEKGSAMSRKD